MAKVGKIEQLCHSLTRGTVRESVGGTDGRDDGYRSTPSGRNSGWIGSERQPLPDLGGGFGYSKPMWNNS